MVKVNGVAEGIVDFFKMPGLVGMPLRYIALNAVIRDLDFDVIAEIMNTVSFISTGEKGSYNAVDANDAYEEVLQECMAENEELQPIDVIFIERDCNGATFQEIADTLNEMGFLNSRLSPYSGQLVRQQYLRQNQLDAAA